MERILRALVWRSELFPPSTHCRGRRDAEARKWRRMWGFLSNNRDELLKRCREKVAQRPARGATFEQLAHGVPLFFDQLTRTLEAEDRGDDVGGKFISGPSGGDGSALSEMGISAAAHGKELLRLGYTVDQVVHDYGDLCQAITDLAVERDAPFSVDHFRTLNRCLDNAIADAVTEFSSGRDEAMALRQSDAENQRLGELAHELRNHLQTAKLAFAALESGRLPIGGSTGGLMKRSLASLEALVDEALEAARSVAHAPRRPLVFSLAVFVADAAQVAALYAAGSRCSLIIHEIEPSLAIGGNRELLLDALGNLIQNAFKFTKTGGTIVVRGHASGDRVLVDVQDQCGGLPPGSAEALFAPFKQGLDDRRGLGLGLSIARRSVGFDGGELTVQDLPGEGCVFTISLPLKSLA